MEVADVAGLGGGEFGELGEDVLRKARRKSSGGGGCLRCHCGLLATGICQLVQIQTFSCLSGEDG